MTEERTKNGYRIFYIVQIVLILVWGAELLYTDSYYVNYLLIMVLGGISFYLNARAGAHLTHDPLSKPVRILVIVFAAVFSCMTCFSNYAIWGMLGQTIGLWGAAFFLFKLLAVLLLLAGGFFVFWHIFHLFAIRIRLFVWKERKKTASPILVFFICFLLLVITRLFVLFTTSYPGVLTPDSISQITQIVTGSYSNHHPIFHTFVIKLFFSLGMKLFHDINAAVAVYSVFQVLFTSASFSFVMSTMTRMKAPKWSIVLTALFFLIMPYHLLFSFTMWKDVMFSCFVLLFVLFLYRCLEGDIGNKVFNFILLTISSIGICLLRSNGFFVFLLLVLFFLIFWKFKMKKIVIMFGLVLVLSFLMKNTLVAKLNIEQPDTIESLSIPAQQIARVVSEENDLTEWERETLEKVVNIDKISKKYKPHKSDPIKNLVRKTGDQNLIRENKGDYIKLYLTLGLKHPLAYARAWIDQTRGYWNSGYEYWRWKEYVKKNDLGLKKTPAVPFLETAFHTYYEAFQNLNVTRLFLSIGLFFWLHLLMLFAAMIRKDKLAAYCTLPVLFLVVSLLVATPVHSEFRYLYAAFCTIPVVALIALRPIKKKER